MRRLPGKEFLLRARRVHGARYIYDQTRYKSYHERVAIRCRQHGLFHLSPAKHISNRRGCPKCGFERRRVLKRLSPRVFLARCRKVHEVFYDYSKTKYVHMNMDITITCPLHGPFVQRPINHILGRGCWECAKRKISKAQGYTQMEWLRRARRAHGNRYNYRLVKYRGANTKVRILCPKHGAFYQSPISHIRGFGCSSCTDYGFSPDAPAILYYVRLQTKKRRLLWKIGITKHTVRKRYANVKGIQIDPIKIWKYKKGRDAYQREQSIRKKFVKFLYKGKNVLFGESKSSREIFVRDVLGLDGVPRHAIQFDSP